MSLTGRLRGEVAWLGCLDRGSLVRPAAIVLPVGRTKDPRSVEGLALGFAFQGVACF